MFRKLMAIETEQARRHPAEILPDLDLDEDGLLAMAGSLVHSLFMPSRFGLCPARHDI